MLKRTPKSKENQVVEQESQLKEAQTKESQYKIIQSLCDSDVEVSAVDIKADFNKAGVILKMKTKNDIKVSFVADVRIAKNKQGEIILQTV